MINLSALDEEYVLEKAGLVEEFLSKIKFDEELINGLFQYAVAGGRRARPVMVLMAAESAGSGPESVLPAAVAVELGHKASLIHDDLVDGDEYRRGRESFWKKHGVRESIITGDLLLGKAFSLIDQLDVKPEVKGGCYALFARVYNTMSVGQAKDMAFEGKDNVPLEDSMRMLYEKTAILCEMPMRLGGVLGGAGRTQLESLGAYGRNMGLAFQVLNDLNNLTQFEGQHGRGKPTDITKGKKTSVISFALEHVRGEDRERVRKILSAEVVDSESIMELIELLSSSKTIEAVGSIASGFMEKAQDSLTVLPDSRAKEVFVKLADPAAMRLGGYFGLLEGENRR